MLVKIGLIFLQFLEILLLKIEPLELRSGFFNNGFPSEERSRDPPSASEYELLIL